MKATVNYKIIIHVLIWSLLLLLPYIVSSATNRYSIGAIPGVLFTSIGFVHIGMFYTNALYLYPKFYNRRYWWLYILSALLLILLSLWLKFAITERWFPAVLSRKHESYGFIIVSSVDIYIISLAYCRILHRIRREKEQKEMEAARLATELKFLRSQISPHFLFNVLTNLVSLARKRSEQLEPSLIMLSDLMRYMLYDTQGKKVPLATEIEYLNSYIELQKLRFGSDVRVESHIDAGQWGQQYMIEPMLLIPFVENAFKHGVGSVDRPQIHLQLSVKEGWMNFSVRNSFDKSFTAGKEDNTGLGLNNVRTRLNLLYPGKYTLAISEMDDQFHITLILQLT